MGTFVENMGILLIFVLFCSEVAISQDDVTLESDDPYMRVQVSEEVVLKCCFTTKKSVKYTWVRSFQSDKKMIGPKHIKNGTAQGKDVSQCGYLKLESVKLNDSGLYQCQLKYNEDILTHGTYLQIYKPLDKTINLSENTKNKILTGEGILLLLCVLLPSANLLFKSKKVNALEKKKIQKEEENIYQGLNLDDCCTTYDQIQRSQAHGPYQDVCNIIEEEEEIQLEKP
ncbi:B-cell antigen receptor complex-associated protein alpha chain [Anabas testudineus]|uniref:Ig-like domain-containing protein n=1 Tax=Anabas testudineus TaxID=64144 RepID=A0A3Q1J316_ANATE|nr:B-cell antigen receptor complex-associated protein alpha chain [Anabas testudineus]